MGLRLVGLSVLGLSEPLLDEEVVFNVETSELLLKEMRGQGMFQDLLLLDLQEQHEGQWQGP